MRGDQPTSQETYVLRRLSCLKNHPTFKTQNLIFLSLCENGRKHFPCVSYGRLWDVSVCLLTPEAVLQGDPVRCCCCVWHSCMMLHSSAAHLSAPVSLSRELPFDWGRCLVAEKQIPKANFSHLQLMLFCTYTYERIRKTILWSEQVTIQCTFALGV